MTFDELNDICNKAVIETYGRNVEYKRLYHCSAWYYNTENFYILKSYRTVIAIYDKTNNNFYDFLRAVYGYTSTSCQHIAKMRNLIRLENGGKEVNNIRIDK